MTRMAAWVAAIGAGEPDQAGRLARFRREHPAAVIGEGEFGTWRALIRRPDGETVTIRHTLRELLDRLDEMHAGPG